MIRSGIIAQGPVVAEFEEVFAELVGVKHAIAVNNGTSALVAAIQVLDLKPGDEVITSPFTFIATLNAILEAGATVRFADIRVEDFGLDSGSVENQITERTKVLMPVHLYGQSADIGPLAELAAKHSLTIVEDGAQAHGAKYHGKGVGTFGIGCFSFYATKNLTTGEGGMITTNDDAIAAGLRIMRNQGMRQRYEYVMAGHNYRLTDLQAAVVIPQIAHYSEQVSKRRSNAETLRRSLSDIEGLVVPQQIEGREHVWHQFTLVLPSNFDRDDVIGSLSEQGVGSGIYYPKPVYDYDVYRDRPDVIRSSNPIAEDVSRRCLSIPVHPYLSSDDLATISSAVHIALGR